MGVIKKSVKSVFNIRRWLGWNELANNTKNTFVLGKDLLKKSAKHKKYENFDDAIQKLGLTEQDVAQKKQILIYATLTYALIGIALLAYMFFLLFTLRIFTGLFCGLLAIFSLTYAYSSHYWYILLKHRTWGISFKQWLKLTLNLKVKS